MGGSKLLGLGFWDQTADLEYSPTDVVTREKCTLGNGTYQLFIDHDNDYMSVVGSVGNKPVTHELQDMFSHILWENEFTGCLFLFVWHTLVLHMFPKQCELIFVFCV